MIKLQFYSSWFYVAVLIVCGAGKGYAQDAFDLSPEPMFIFASVANPAQKSAPAPSSTKKVKSANRLDQAKASTKASTKAPTKTPAKAPATTSTTTPADSAPETKASPVSSTQGLSKKDTEEVERFCDNIGSQAADARFQLQRQQLQQLRDQIDERVKTLEEKRREYEVWLEKRNEFLSMAEDSLVEIISKMRPDAAAAQLALMSDLVAASLVLKLSPKISSAIMNELPPEKSAELTQILVSAQQTSSKKKQAQQVIDTK
ncbi:MULTISPECIES: MotE family protein [Bartonella]|uniref:Flagellar motility protein MotE (MotC chaperone) n=1 Tax=Bartonella chomelii TaxID=236402 RepID=A0ABR6E4L6_9HYPH|nr:MULTISPECIES: MotE family protein [Bartonella]MBA9083364.1 flagellar motility protein MotE (MotC chaperone) [Bartonella chomelii]